MDFIIGCSMAKSVSTLYWIRYYANYLHQWFHLTAIIDLEFDYYRKITEETTHYIKYFGFRLKNCRICSYIALYPSILLDRFFVKALFESFRVLFTIVNLLSLLFIVPVGMCRPDIPIKNDAVFYETYNRVGQPRATSHRPPAPATSTGHRPMHRRAL